MIYQIGQFGWNNPYVQIFDYLLYNINLIFPVSIKNQTYN